MAIMGHKLPEVRRLFNDNEIDALLTPDYKGRIDLNDDGVWQHEQISRSNETFIYQLCRADFSRNLVEDILTKVDRPACSPRSKSELPGWISAD